ncbi:MAG TPA: four helix bundle protein [Dehalococcoidia bacterium]|nr:four helix bundle protein [Dehalococcoidia bacterium]
MRDGLPPIVKLSTRLLVDLERAVRRFPRYHKYAVGADLRAQAMAVARCAQRAWRDRAHQLERVDQLGIAIDELKLTMQLGKEIEVFQSFGEFEALARVASDLGRQCGGWRKQLHLKSQNGPATPVPAQRAQRLSSRAAPAGVHP